MPDTEHNESVKQLSTDSADVGTIASRKAVQDPTACTSLPLGQTPEQKPAPTPELAPVNLKTMLARQQAARVLFAEMWDRQQKLRQEAGNAGQE